MNAVGKTRVLHVVGGLAAGGIETWLVQVLRHIDRSQFQNDFVVHTNEPQFYDEEVLSMGARIFPVLDPSNPVAYSKRFRELIRSEGPFEIVHSHVAHFGGFVARAAKGAGVQGAIVHSHNDLTPQTSTAGLLRRAYLGIGRSLIMRHSTVGLACSDKAAQSLFGSGWEQYEKIRILPYGIDLARFEPNVAREELLSSLDVPSDAKVVGHVGRFIEQKNHEFFVRIAEAVLHKDPDSYFVLVGDGALRPNIEQAVDAAGIKERFRFAGLRNDVTELMMSAMDVFLLPSLHEGLPVVLLETQAAGLPAVFSSAITHQIEAIPGLMERVALSESARGLGRPCSGKTECAPALA